MRDRGNQRDGGKARLVVILCLAALGAGLMSAVDLASPNHTSGGGTTTGQHGQDCPPGYHDTGGTCEHNGNGGGNCGDNQSGNNNGHGNGGNDDGFGHQGNCEGTPTTTSTPTSTTTTNPNTTTSSSTTSTNTPRTPTTPVLSTTPTTTPPTTTSPFSPPVDPCAAGLLAHGTRMMVGRRSVLVVTALGENDRRMAGVTVLVRGAGLNAEKATNSAGVARFSVRPTSAGVVRIRLLQASGCGAVSRLGRV